jgi:hypothetical protein
MLAVRLDVLDVVKGVNLEFGAFIGEKTLSGAAGKGVNPAAVCVLLVKLKSGHLFNSIQCKITV